MAAWLALCFVLVTSTISAQETQQIRLFRESDSLVRKVVRQGRSTNIALVLERTPRGISDNVQSVTLSGLHPLGVLDLGGAVNRPFTNNQATFLIRATGDLVGEFIDTITVSSPSSQIDIIINVTVLPSSETWMTRPPILDFGPLVPASSSTRSVFIGNASDSNTTVSLTNLLHPFYPSLAFIDVPSNDVVEVVITCVPDSTDPIPSTQILVLVPSHNPADTKSVQLRLTGPGDELELQCPSHISAGPNSQPDRLVPCTFTIRNVGTQEITAYTIDMFSGPKDIWILDSTTLDGSTLKPGDSARITIIGRTDGSGFSQTATFEIQGGNDTVQGLLARFTIGFDDTTKTERFVFSHDTVHFGVNTEAGSERIRSVLVVHNSSTEAIITNYQLHGPDASQFYLLHRSLPIVAPPLTSDTVIIVGTTTGTGTVTAILTVEGNYHGDTTILYFSDSIVQPPPRDTVNLRLSTHRLKIGQRATVRVVTDATVPSVATNSLIRVSFDGTVIVAEQGSEPVSPGRRGLWTNVRPGPWLAGDTVPQFDIIAALGLTDMSDLTIDSAILRTDEGDTIESTFSSGVVHVIDSRGYHVNSTETATYMSVSPNPATETTTVTYTCEGEHLRLRLFNTLSNVVKDYTPLVLSRTGTIVVDVSDLSVGCYLLRLDTSTSSYALQLVVQ